MCGDNCQCAHVQAIQKSLMMDFARNNGSSLPHAPTTTTVSTEIDDVDQAFMDRIFGPVSPISPFVLIVS